MTHQQSHHDEEVGQTGSFWTSRAFVVFLGFTAIAVVLLWTEHRAHIFGALPYLFILACPLMHIFMHGGHGHGHRQHRRNLPQINGDRAGDKLDGGSS